VKTKWSITTFFSFFLSDLVFHSQSILGQNSPTQLLCSTSTVSRVTKVNSKTNYARKHIAQAQLGQLQFSTLPVKMAIMGWKPVDLRHQVHRSGQDSDCGHCGTSGSLYAAVRRAAVPVNSATDFQYSRSDWRPWCLDSRLEYHLEIWHRPHTLIIKIKFYLLEIWHTLIIKNFTFHST